MTCSVSSRDPVERLVGRLSRTSLASSGPAYAVLAGVHVSVLTALLS